MANETSKTRQVRGENFFEEYFQGKVLDIGGAKGDLVCPQVEIFDKENGDANQILKFLPKESYDTVYSSHCLEHMTYPKEALRQWWELLKPGGYLVLVVPDEDLYEQGIWPSIFNPEHKATFRLDATTSWSPVSHEIRSLVSALPNANILSAEKHDHHYDYSLITKPGSVWVPKTRWVRFLYKRVSKSPPKIRPWFRKQVDRLARARNIPVDQTLGAALAQIQIVAYKQPSPPDAH